MLVVAAFVLYVSTLQTALYNDGIFFVNRLEAGELLFNHLLYLPLVDLAHRTITLVAPVAVETTLKLVSALCAAATLVLVPELARQLLRGAPGMGPAVAATATLAVLPGYWFFATASELHAPHALCATLLLLGLLRAMDERRRQTTGDGLLQLLGAGLTPAMHASGVAAVLPAAYAAARSGSQRRGVLAALGLGFGLFLVVYLGILLGSDALDHYQSQFGSAHLNALTQPGRLPQMVTTCLSELFLYSAPASTLVPLGLRVLFPLAPGAGWLCVLWLLAWPLIALPIADHAHGSYYLTTFPVQAVLSVLALLHLSRGVASALVTTAVAALPGIAILAGEGWGLLAWCLCAGCLCAGYRLLGSRPVLSPAGTGRLSGLLALPLASLLLSSILHVPRFDDDPVREQIRAVHALSKEDARIIVLESDVAVCRHWMRYLPHSRRRLLNPLVAELDPEAGDRHQLGYQEQVAAALAEGRQVWLVGPLAGWERARFVSRFVQHLRDSYRLETPAGAPENVRRVTPR